MPSDINSNDSDSGSVPLETSGKKSINVFSSLPREITEDELQNSSGALKLLLSHYDRLLSENEKMNDMCADYHKKDKENAVLNERLSEFKSRWILIDISKMVGSLLIGITPCIWDYSKGFSWYIIILGILLIAGSFVAQRYFSFKAEENKK